MINKLATIFSPGSGPVNSVQSVEPPSLVPQLERGKLLTAIVVESQGTNMFLLEAAGTQFSVQSSLSLIKGEQVQFQVLSTAPVLELQKVENPLPAQIRRTLPLTGAAINLNPLLRSLQTSFFAAQPVQQDNTALSAGNKGTVLQGLTGHDSQVAFSLPEKLDAGAVEQVVRQGNYRVKATVLENLAENRSLVRIGTESLLLQGRIEAGPGENRVLQLQSLQPAITFLPVNAGEAPLHTLQPLTVIAQDQGLLSALLRVLQLPIVTGLDLLQPSQQQLLKDLSSIQPKQLQGSGAGAELKRSIGLLGIRSETLLAQGKGADAATQLKSLLAEISRVFQGQEKISSSANRLLTTLESSQFLQATLVNDSVFLFPLPFSFVEKGYLMVEKETEQHGGEGEQEERFSCVLHLTMEGLGNIRVNCSQNEELTRISFFLESPEKAEFVSGFGDELKKRISSAPLLTLSFDSGAEDPGATLLQKVMPAEHSVLQIRV